jgi:hypothetical protein
MDDRLLDALLSEPVRMLPQGGGDAAPDKSLANKLTFPV